jgi:hypothetical protein
MSQFPVNPGMYAEETFSEAPRTSGLAIAALICALVFCIPGVPLLGVILGLVAIVGMIGQASLRGRGLAIAAVVIGLAVSGMQAAGGWWAYQFTRQFFVLFRDSPVEMMKSGFAGDYPAFRTHLLGAAAQQDDAAIQQFIDDVRGRWGELSGIEMKPNQRQQAPPPGGPNASTAEVEYVATFGASRVPVVIEFRFEPGPAAGGASSTGAAGFLRMGISAIEFEDPDKGDIRFPKLPQAPGSASDAAAAPPVGAE